MVIIRPCVFAPPSRIVLLLASLLCCLPAAIAQEAQDADEGSAAVAGQEAHPYVLADPALEVLRHDPQYAGGFAAGSALADILARPEFLDEGRAPEGEGLLARLQRWLNSLPGLGAIPGDRWWALGLAAILLGLVVYLLVRISWRLGQRRQGKDGKEEGRRGRPRTSAEFLAEAGTLAQRGQYRKALRYRFLALVLTSGLPDNRLLTNSQIMRQLTKRDPSVAGELGRLVSGVEDIWYGQQDCPPRRYEQLAQLAGGLQQKLAVEDA